ncbi:hypothetical protein SUVZ_16G4130 [Saccharomyces uvarum]|uniref:Uncharacterized protein n=1 Tax=Saccharomyces uvarum TaxID=230603 RepID=A0ABN8WMC9_SACUV|nr:hypothetical protein SUVZ_16G4130 [Saccharomyces uvarum]
MSATFKKIKLMFKRNDRQYLPNYGTEMKPKNKNTVITRHDLLIAYEREQRASLDRSNSIRNVQLQDKRLEKRTKRNT